MTDKISLRRQARTHRAKLGPVLPGFAAAIAAFAPKLVFGDEAVIGGYAALAGEADPRLLLEALHRRGANLALPRVVTKDAPLSFHRWTPADALTAGAFGVPEPPASADSVNPNILLVPLLAYDGQGYRLGYGGGYYDRTLEILKSKGEVLAIGVAYANQEIPSVPHEAHDMRMDMILTECGLRRFIV